MYRVKFTLHGGSVQFLVDEKIDDVHLLGDWNEDGITEFHTPGYAMNAAVVHAVRYLRHRNAKAGGGGRGIWEIERRDDRPRWVAVD